jgi:hypothetical protein
MRKVSLKSSLRPDDVEEVLITEDPLEVECDSGSVVIIPEPLYQRMLLTAQIVVNNVLPAIDPDAPDDAVYKITCKRVDKPKTKSEEFINNERKELC